MPAPPEEPPTAALAVGVIAGLDWSVSFVDNDNEMFAREPSAACVRRDYYDRTRLLKLDQSGAKYPELSPGDE